MNTQNNDNAQPAGQPPELRSNDLVRLLKGCAYELWRASFSGQSPALRELFDELRNPVVGDLVMEVTTHRVSNRDPLEGIGTLVAHGRAPYYATREEARAAGYEDDEPIPDREVWDIRLDFDDGRLFRWSNASFIKVKTSDQPNTVHEPQAPQKNT